MASVIELRAGAISTFERIGTTAALTLVFNDHRPSLQRMQDNLHNLIGRIDSARLGKRYTQFPPQRRTHGFACAEQIGTHPHWHGALTIAPVEIATLAVMIDKAWKEIAPAGSTLLVESDTGWLSYCVKSLRTSDDYVIF